MTPDTALAARLVAMETTSQDHSPFSNLFERALCSAYRSGQLITLADHERAVQDLIAERDFLRVENEAMREMSAAPVEGLLKNRLREMRERREAVDKAVEACAKICDDAHREDLAAAIRSRGVAP
ncbi:hypothetical protein [Cypionkella sp. TWP1-2-1b2]|uniref:hypothetical protein n=1 Tax=Cypionkella sp. TWP1-2-1b2 TaxID=2804675 RepID=UPI003CE9B581